MVTDSPLQSLAKLAHFLSTFVKLGDDDDDDDDDNGDHDDVDDDDGNLSGRRSGMAN